MSLPSERYRLKLQVGEETKVRNFIYTRRALNVDYFHTDDEEKLQLKFIRYGRRYHKFSKSNIKSTSGVFRSNLNLFIRLCLFKSELKCLLRKDTRLTVRR